MNLHLILLALVVLFITSSCKESSSDVILGKVTLTFDSINSKLVESEFKYDSLLINRVNEDSMVIIRYMGGSGYYDYTTFSLINQIFYEKRMVPQLIIEGETKTSIVSIPTFLQNDTIFDYMPDDDFFSVFVSSLSFDKCKYQIKKDGSKFLTIKQSLTDTTYNEIYYYDRYYNIYKYINTWKDNKCVYVRNN